ncbi:cytochrome P450 [Zopfia rhizophila CBS 207.26]|uniref:Cytochrome P450 n=1 Tax=Zopfia rhizophila CBS 207.26 TaxID=1314779 RepID=A0A6A6DVA2_9PEZI|nr:cytochrome P450 [Zopfia rhizophila CBS 207.26]
MGAVLFIHDSPGFAFRKHLRLTFRIMAAIKSPGLGYVAILFIIYLLYVSYKILRIGYRDKRLPPGPPTLPILGNAHQIPTKKFYLKLKEWSDQYGKIFSVKLGSGTMIVLNDRRAVHDLIDKKSAIYSERPIDYNSEVAMGNENFAIMHATPMWRAQRKVASQNLAPRVLDEKVAPIQEAEISQLMHDLLETPDQFSNHMKRATASVASIVLYGFRAPTFDNFWVTSVYEAVNHVNRTLEPGTYPPTEQFPILKYIPDRWAPWNARAKLCYSTMTKIWAEARDKVDERRRNGDDRPSIADKLLSGATKLDTPLTYNQFNNFLGALQMGGAETTASMMLTNILYLAKHPWVQEKARVELDRVCGTERMPMWSDFSQTPYINCIVKEGLRIRPVAPVNLAHRVNRDDWFDGMLIPKDSIIFVPSYALHHTEYDDPETYNPDRYLKHPKLAMDYAGNRNPHHYAYGAGRRICVGIHLAERTQWRITAKLLWAFNIEPAVDEVTGEVVELDLNSYSEGLLHQPMPYRVKITPRSDKHAEVIRKDFEGVEDFLRKWE